MVSKEAPLGWPDVGVLRSGVLREVGGRREVVEETGRRNVHLLLELEAGILQFPDFNTAEASTNSNRPNGWNWRAVFELGELTDARANSAEDATVDVVITKREVMVVHLITSLDEQRALVARGRGALTLNLNNSIVTLLPSNLVICRALLEGVVWYSSDMPAEGIHNGLLNSSDSANSAIVAMILVGGRCSVRGLWGSVFVDGW